MSYCVIKYNIINSNVVQIDNSDVSYYIFEWDVIKNNNFLIQYYIQSFNSIRLKCAHF